MVKPLIYVGIDPGFKRVGIGAVTYGVGDLVYFDYLEDWNPIDLYNLLLKLSAKYNIHKAGVEHVHAMKDQGVSSTGKFMKSTGIIIGVLVGVGITYTEITPQKWKTVHPSLKAEKGETKTQKKARSLTYVMSRYPECGLDQIKARKAAKVDMADAISIATYMFEFSI